MEDTSPQIKRVMVMTSIGRTTSYMHKLTCWLGNSSGVQIVEMSLFKAYCTPPYTAPLWTKYKRVSVQKLQSASNDGLCILLKKPRWSSASELFCRVGVATFHALLRNLKYTFICRLNGSCNLIIGLLSNPGFSMVRYQSSMWKHWYQCLF